MKPDFLVIGAQKCATSSLCERLARHPAVFLTEPKEPYFFSHSDVWRRGWGWYESLFADSGAARARGEGSTTYTQHLLYPEAAERIARHLPEARLLFIARDPLERIRSHWMHLRARENRETLPFDEAVRTRPEYLDHSRYGHQLSFYDAHFPPERILVLFFEDYRRDPEEVTRRALAHLGVDPAEGAARRGRESAGARHASAEGRVDTPVTGIVRRLPGFRTLRDAAPGPLREALRRVLKRPIGERPMWSEEARAWALERIGEETRAFLRRHGKSEDFWPSVGGRPLEPVRAGDAES